MFLTIALLTVTAMDADYIYRAIDNYETVESYQATLRARNNGSTEIIKYYYKRPGFVRMEFVKPYAGAVIVYSPITKKVRVKPFKSLELFIFTLDPDNRLITSSKGHTKAFDNIRPFVHKKHIIKNNAYLKVFMIPFFVI